MPNISNQDMRYREESSGEHLTKDGQPDHRYKENRSDNEHSSSHLTKDGQPDHRYKENRSDDEQHSGRRSNEQYDDNDGMLKYLLVNAFTSLVTTDRFSTIGRYSNQS